MREKEKEGFSLGSGSVWPSSPAVPSSPTRLVPNSPNAIEPSHKERGVNHEVSSVVYSVIIGLALILQAALPSFVSPTLSAFSVTSCICEHVKAQSS